jgi:hypothetical protein
MESQRGLLEFSLTSREHVLRLQDQLGILVAQVTRGGVVLIIVRVSPPPLEELLLVRAQTSEVRDGARTLARTGSSGIGCCTGAPSSSWPPQVEDSSSDVQTTRESDDRTSALRGIISSPADGWSDCSPAGWSRLARSNWGRRTRARQQLEAAHHSRERRVEQLKGNSRCNRQLSYDASVH